MLARATHVVDHQVIVGDAGALVGMIPEPADIRDPFAGVVNADMGKRDAPARRPTRAVVTLEQFQPALVTLRNVPRHLG